MDERSADSPKTPPSPLRIQTPIRGSPSISSTPPSQSDPQSLKALLTQATDRALLFLSNASNETLGACLVGLGATTYIVLGRVGLVLIGVVGGVVLHATWENSHGRSGDAKLTEATRRREIGLDVAQRVLDWRTKRASIDSDADGLGINLGAAKAEGFSQFKPETAAALNAFTDAVIGDYVKWWYSPILPAELAFPSSCRRTLSSFILSLSANVSRKRPADTFIEFTTNSSSIIIVFLNELSSAVSGSPNTAAPEAVQTYLRLKPQCNLANLMDQTHQHRKLQMIADDILDSYLEPAVYRCAPVRVFLREMLANVVLDMTVQRCARAEWINEWIVYLLEDGEPELLNVIDEGVQSAGAMEPASLKKASIASLESIEEAPPDSPTTRSHNRTKSRAEEAMDEAMREAKRLSQLIIEEDERRQREQQQHEPQQPQQQPQQQEQQQPPPPAPEQNILPTPNTDLGDLSDGTTQGIHTPTSSQSGINGEGSKTPASSLPEERKSDEVTPNPSRDSFTSFDQLGSAQVPDAIAEEQDYQSLAPQTEVLTLLNATISIFDDSTSGEKRPLKTKPVADYIIQIEPHSSHFPGWMIPRTYADFETLHEVMRRISNITGVEFNKIHSVLPTWKGRTKPQLRDELERYLGDAMRFEQLAESEGMKRFLEKSRGLTQDSGQKGFWPNPANVGKGMLDVLTKAPVQVAGGVAGGGKMLFGGVAGVLGAAGGAAARQKAAQGVHPANTSSTSSVDMIVGGPKATYDKATELLSAEQEALKKPPTPLNLNGIRPSLEPRRSSSLTGRSFQRAGSVSPRPSSASIDQIRSTDSPVETTPASATSMRLPPLPQEMPDDFSTLSPRSALLPDHTSHMSVDGTSFFDVPTPPTPRSPRGQSPNPSGTHTPALRSPPSRSSLQAARAPPTATTPTTSTRPDSSETERRQTRPDSSETERRRTVPLSEPEAQVTVELLFAVITELYTLSSAWTLRRTLLGAAKTFLLRPGNPQLESIRCLIQETVLDANTTDAGVAALVRKLRENAVPTEAELRAWPKDRTDEERERLRVKARDLLVRRGMPQALTSVMGAAASGEALGKVFDCLQVPEVARGVVFGLTLQAVRAVTQ